MNWCQAFPEAILDIIKGLTLEEDEDPTWVFRKKPLSRIKDLETKQRRLIGPSTM